MKASIPRSRHLAFSLVELLVVIAVIGILAGIAIPMISNINANSAKAKAKRNAQNICSVYGAARSAFSSTTKEGIVGELAQGISGGGSFGSNRFQLNVSAGERAAALAYCTYDSSDEIMSYDPGGAATAGQAPEDHEWHDVRVVVHEDLWTIVADLNVRFPNYEHAGYNLTLPYGDVPKSMLTRRLK